MECLYTTTYRSCLVDVPLYEVQSLHNIDYELRIKLLSATDDIIAMILMIKMTVRTHT